MNEILFNDRFQSVWCRDIMSGVAKTMKPLNSWLCTAISLFFLWNNIHLKTLNTLFRITFQHFVRLPISTYNRIMKYILVFNYVVFIDIYGSSFCWQFHIFQIHCTCILPYYVCTWCNQMCISFFFSNFPDIYWILYLVKFR